MTDEVTDQHGDRRVVRIGTRGSQLALWQANEVAKKLSELGFVPKLVTVRTTGDKRHDVPLSAIGGKALFIRELEDQLEKKTIDIAVHSLKDVPSIVAPKFRLVSFLERADARDAYVQLDCTPIAELHEGAVIGTSSPRRRAQLRQLFPHIKVDEMRGNVDSRINKLRAGLYDAAVLARAGLLRLGRECEITSNFELDEMVPAAGQGIVCIEVLTADERNAEIARQINHAPTERAALAERGVLQKFGTKLDCYSSVAVHATFEDGRTNIRAFLSDVDGARAIRAQRSGDDDAAVIAEVAEELIGQGALELLRSHA